MTITPDWGPYAGPDDAAKRLGQVADRIAPELGLAWYGAAGLVPLRRPRFDAQGVGACFVAQWISSPPPLPPAPQGLWQEIKAAVRDAFTAYGEAEMVNSEVALAQGQAINKALFSGDKKKDFAGVAMDALAVGVAIIAGLTGVGLIADIAFAGGVALLAMDGTAYGLEVAGYQDAADKMNKVDEPARILATLLTLPDAGWNGYKAIRELELVKAARTSSLRRAGRYEAQSVLTPRVGAGAAAEAARAAKAEKLAALGEEANKRAAAYAQRMKRIWALDLAPKGVLTPLSIALLTDMEATTSDPGHVAAFMRHYVFHVDAVTRQDP